MAKKMKPVAQPADDAKEQKRGWGWYLIIGGLAGGFGVAPLFFGFVPLGIYALILPD